MLLRIPFEVRQFLKESKAVSSVTSSGCRAVERDSSCRHPDETPLVRRTHLYESLQLALSLSDLNPDLCSSSLQVSRG